MSVRSAYRRLRRWHQDRRTARAQARADDEQRRLDDARRRFLNDLEWLGIETRREDRERERGWK